MEGGLSMGSTSTHDDRSFGDLARQVSENISQLARKEVALAKAEIAEKSRRLAVGAGLVAAAAVLGLVMLGAFAAAAILALATTLSAWLAAVIVGVVIALAAAVLALVGIKQLRRAAPPVPNEAAESVKEDVAWVKTQVKSGLR
jgi:protein-S-isoprenylcysteine O-methyltransferase Ste14